jgi:hypothetical protein
LPLIRRICRGLAPVFGNRQCDHYEQNARQCVLLREQRVADIVEDGRCVYSMMTFTQDELSERFSGVDDKEDFPLETLIGRLRRITWNGAGSPIRWFKYLKTSFRRAALRAAASQGFAVEQQQCGTCAHLTLTRPHLCLELDQERELRDPPCDRFVAALPVFEHDPPHGEGEEDGNDLESRFEPEARRRSDRAEKELADKLEVESLRLALEKRAESQPEGGAERARFTRQHDLFVTLHQVVGEVDSDRQVVGTLAPLMGVSRNTVRRDLEQIREYLDTHYAQLGHEDNPG